MFDNQCNATEKVYLQKTEMQCFQKVFKEKLIINYFKIKKKKEKSSADDLEHALMQHIITKSCEELYEHRDQKNTSKNEKCFT